MQSDRFRRFEARAGRGRLSAVVIIVTGVVLVAGAGLLSVLEIAQHAPFVFLILVAIGYCVFLVWALRGRATVLDVSAEQIVIDEGRGGTFPLVGARLGVWTIPVMGVKGGTVLHLIHGARTYRLCGRDHRPRPGTVLRAGSTEHVDAVMPAAEFESLLAILPGMHDAAFAPISTAATRVELFSNPASIRTLFRSMAPWLITLALLSVVGIALGGLEEMVQESLLQFAGLALMIPIVVGGIVATIRQGMRKKMPLLEIELERGELRLRDPNRGALVSTASVASMGIARGRHRTTGAGSVEYPTITLQIPGRPALTLGVFDSRYGWNDRTSSAWVAPRYVVGPPDWNALTEALGVAGFVAFRDL